MPNAPNSPYWVLRGDTGSPYRIPLCHASFLMIPVQGPEPRGLMASLSGLMGNRNVVADPAFDVHDVRLTSTDGVRTLRSKSYGPTDVTASCCIDPATAGPGEDTTLTLPLQVTGNVAATAVWDTDTHLSWTMKPAPEIQLDLLPHGGGAAVAHTVITFTWLLQNWADGTDLTGFKFRGSLHDALISLGNPVLTGGPPYKLQVSAVLATRVRAVAWTYLHVPSAKEVTFLETYRDQRVLPKGGEMAGFAAFGANSAVQRSLDDDAIPGFLAHPPSGFQPVSAGEAFLYPTAGEIRAIQGQLAARGNAGRLATARASLLTLDNLPAEAREMRRRDLNNQIVAYQALAVNIQELLEAGANVDDHGERATLTILKEYDQNTQNIIIRRAGGCFVHMSWGTAAIFLRRNGHYYLKRLYIAGYGARTAYVLDRDCNVASFGTSGAAVVAAAPDAVTAVRMAHSAPVVALNTQTTFHNRGALTTPTTAWASITFPDNDDWLVERAITYGVSSCSASWLFPNQDMPEAFVFAHIDNNAAPPIEHAVRWLINQGLVGNTDFRCIGFIVPQIEEVEKSSVPVVFPGGLGGMTYEGVLCPRETHLGDTLSGQFNRGYDAVGMDFENGSVDPAVVGVFGPRGYQPTAMVNHTPASQGNDCMARRVLRDAQRYVYGTTPATIARHAVARIGDWKTFLRDIYFTFQTDERMRTAADDNPFSRMRSEVLSQRKIFRLRQAGGRLYAAMRGAGACQPISAKSILVISDDQRAELENR
jgi:hypothetical protein